MGCVDVTRNRENNILPWKVGVPKTEEVSSAAPLILKDEEKQFGLVLNSECPDECKELIIELLREYLGYQKEFAYLTPDFQNSSQNYPDNISDVIILDLKLNTLKDNSNECAYIDCKPQRKGGIRRKLEIKKGSSWNRVGKNYRETTRRGLDIRLR